MQWAKQNYKHLANIQLADDCLSDSQADIEILIGSDNIWKFMLGEVRRGETGDSPVAVSTVLGWVLSGPAGKVRGHKLCSVNFNATHVLRIESEPVSVVSHEDVSLDSAVSSLWDLGNLGILDKNSVHDEFFENILFDKGRYTVRLPFRKHHDTLPDNFDLSVTRLNSLVRHLKKSPELATEYSKVIEDQKKQSITEEFNPFLEKAEVGKTHYLSHHAVIRQDAYTTKVRVVFDGSAQCDPGLPSLNDILETEPSTVSAIFDVLLRFRSKRYL